MMLGDNMLVFRKKQKDGRRLLFLYSRTEHEEAALFRTPIWRYPMRSHSFCLI